MKTPIFTLAAALTVVALPSGAIAQNSAKCLSPAEAQSLITVALPDIIGSIVDKCRPALPAGSFVARSGADLLAKYKAGATTAWPSAKKALLKMVDVDAAMMNSLPDEALKGFFSAGVTQGVTRDVKAESCGDVDRVAAALAPLPPENTASLVTMFIEMDARRKAAPGTPAKSPIPICKPATAAASK